MKAITYHLRLLEPLLVTALDGDPNSAVSSDHIPGSVMRGAFIGLAMRREKRAELDAADAAVRRLFFSDSTCYLNAYPTIANARALPVPASWHVQKGEKSPASDFARAAQGERPQNPKGLGGFVTVNNGQFSQTHPTRIVAVHTQRDRKKGRAIEDSGAVYRYDALAAGQVFAGAIVCHEESDADYLHELITGAPEIAIGGARSAGYGQVRFERVRLVQDWHEAESHFQDGGKLVVTLLSDAIVRNAHGEYEPNVAAFTAALARRLGASVEDFGEATSAFLATTMVGGFNRKWGLPLPQTAALCMGGVVVYANHRLNADHAAWLMQAGIGERRAEGFGRIGINLFAQARYTLAVRAEAKIEPSAEKPLALGHLPEQLQQRLMLARTERKLTEEANRISISAPPRSSQISALRAAVQDQIRTGTGLFDYLKHLGERPVTRRQFERARIGGKPMLDWLQTKISEKDDLAYTLRLIDAVLAKAGKETKKGDDR